VALAGGGGIADSIVPVKAPLIGGGDLSTAVKGIATATSGCRRCSRRRASARANYDFFGAGPASADDKRTVAQKGLLQEKLGPTWGLHCQDSSLAMGDLTGDRGQAGRRLCGGGA